MKAIAIQYRGGVLVNGDVGVLQASSPQAETPQPQDAPKPIPSFYIGGFNEASVEYDGTRFRFDDNGKKPLSVLVTNKRAPLLQQGCKAHRVIAHLVFRSTARETIVDRAFWIGSVENEVPFESPQTRHLLLGFSEGDRWKSYNNPNAYATFFYGGGELAESSPEEREIVYSDRFEVDISVISLEDNRTLAERTAIIERQGIWYSARWKE